MTLGFIININYAIELTMFRFIRKFSDGITFFEAKINLDLYDWDHNPKIEINLLILNTTMIELLIYNRHHKPKGDPML